MKFAARIAVASLVLAPALAYAQEAKPAEKPKRPSIYDAKADARAAVEAAGTRARRDSQRILVMFGGDWCGWCHQLHDLFASDADIHKTLKDEYVLVMVDTQAPNADALLKECQGDLERVGYPFLAVLGADGKVVTRQPTDVLEEGDHHDPKKVKAFLDRWVAPKLSAEAVLKDGLAKASAEDKLVFLHFGAPWCGWCHRLDAFLAKQEIAEILGRDFIDVKIDEDRMTGGKELDARFRKGASGGIPWIAFLDAKGNVLATSDGPDGNIGYPAKPDEIAHFANMLAVARRIEPEQKEAILKVLKDEGSAIERASRERAKAAAPRAN
nr:thiol:disulfide interchange protein DsbD [uncultured bacterium]